MQYSNCVTTDASKHSSSFYAGNNFLSILYIDLVEVYKVMPGAGKAK